MREPVAGVGCFLFVLGMVETVVKECGNSQLVNEVREQKTRTAALSASERPGRHSADDDTLRAASEFRWGALGGH